MSVAPWGEAHRREAYAAAARASAEIAVSTGKVAAHDAMEGMIGHANNEDWYRAALARMGLDAARIDREVRRVRALAEGRLVRDSFVGVRAQPGDPTVYRRPDADAARATVTAWRRDTVMPRVVRVTRIRRAP